MSKPLNPYFAGQMIFGDLDSFKQTYPYRGTTLEIDEFLGLTEGTTIYAADPGGKLFFVSGTFKGPSTDAVAAQVAFLQEFAGFVGVYRRPTNDIPPSDVQIIHNCYFTVNDLTFGTVTQLGVNNYGQTYALVIRQKALVG